MGDFIAGFWGPGVQEEREVCDRCGDLLPDCDCDEWDETNEDDDE